MCSASGPAEPACGGSEAPPTEPAGASLVALSYCIDHWADAETECHGACDGPYCRFCGSDRRLEVWVTVGHPQRRAPYLRSIECSSCFGYECSNQVCPCCLQDYKYFAALLQTCTTLRDVGLGPSSGPCRRLTCRNKREAGQAAASSSNQRPVATPGQPQAAQAATDSKRGWSWPPNRFSQRFPGYVTNLPRRWEDLRRCYSAPPERRKGGPRRIPPRLPPGNIAEFGGP